MTITVVNKYKQPDHIYCGRGTPLGNPFPLRAGNDRDLVCDKYRDWFYEKVDEENWLKGNNPNPQTEMLRDIYSKALQGDINLGCFCAPKRCHCDTIKEFLDYKIEELLK